MQPQWTKFGCSWSRDCIAADNYILYCEFSYDTPTPRAIKPTLSPRQDMDTWLQDNVGFMLNSMRKAVGPKDPELKLSGAQVTQAQDDADKCDGHKNNLYDQAVFQIQRRHRAI